MDTTNHPFNRVRILDFACRLGAFVVSQISACYEIKMVWPYPFKAFMISPSNIFNNQKPSLCVATC